MAPMTLDQLLQRAMQLRQRGAFDECEQLCRQILTAQPNHAGALNLLGILAAQAERPDIAAMLFRHAIAVDPGPAEYHSNLGNILRALDDTDGAIAAYRDALQRRPDLAQIHSNLGCALLKKGEMENAVTSLRHAISLQPALAEAQSNLGNALMDLQRIPEAIAAYRAAISLGTPDLADLAELQTNLALAQLSAGEWEEGWRRFQWRLKCRDCTLPPDLLARPRWNGEHLAGQTLLLFTEQGLGDSFQFIRYVKRACQHGGNIVVACRKEQHRLFSQLPYPVTWIPDDQPLPRFDVQCPLLSLPHMFRTTPHTIPPQDPPLTAPPELAHAWRERLAGDGMKVGLAWAGSSGGRQYATRPIPLRCLAPLVEIPGIRLVSLQKGPAAEHWHTHFPGMLDASPHLHDFAETAALIENLDLVITIDSAIAHLAGAMHKPNWVLLPFGADWRWQPNHNATPWYPATRMFRQTHPGDWNPVAASLKKEFADQTK